MEFASPRRAILLLFASMSALPANPQREEFAVLRAEPSRWIPIAQEIARAHSCTGELEAFAKGSNLVAAIGSDLVLKIFPPFLGHQFTAERTALGHLAGKLSVAIPEVAGEGEREGWPYLLLSRLPGTVGEDAWPALDERAREALLARIGALIAEVQSLPPGPIGALEPKWPAFVESQIAGARERHRRLAMPAQFLEGMEEFLAEARTLIPLEPSAILTGEYVPENLLLADEALQGLIDFGDVMCGWREYDLLGPSLFMAAGFPRRMNALFAGYGVALDAKVRRRLMLLWLLHRHSDLPHQLRLDGWEREASLEALEARIWPL